MFPEGLYFEKDKINSKQYDKNIKMGVDSLRELQNNHEASKTS